MLIIGYMITTVSSRQLEQAISSAMNIYGSQLRLSLDAMVISCDQLTKSFLIDAGLLKNLNRNDLNVTERIVFNRQIRDQLYRISIIDQHIENVILITPKSEVLYYSRTYNVIDSQALLSQRWMQELMQSERTLNFSSVHNQNYCERIPGKMAITVCRRLYDTGGYFCGFMLFEYRPEYLFPLNSAFAELEQRYGVRMQVLNADRKLMYDSAAQSGSITWQDAEQSEPVRDAHDLSLRHTSDRSGLNVIVTAPLDRVYAQPRRLLLFALLCLAVSSVAVIATVSAIARRLTNPVQRLEAAMISTEGGNYTIVENISGRDEIARMTGIYNDMIIREKAMVEQVYKAELKQEQARLVALRAQINPHMLFNTLETIRMKALIDGNEDVSGMVKALSDMFRLSLQDESTMHTIRDEMDYTKHFIALQNIRFRDRFHLKEEIPEEIGQAQIISLVFQPVVENAIVHGCRSGSSDLAILICACKKDGLIEIMIRDDGRGMSGEQLEKLNRYIHGESTERPGKKDVQSHGIGLLNIHERLMLQYGSPCGIQIDSEEGKGTKVTILIPYLNSAEENPHPKEKA